MEEGKPKPTGHPRPAPAFQYLKHVSILSTASFFALLLFSSRLLPPVDQAGWGVILYLAACAAFFLSILAAQAGMWLEVAGSSAEEPERAGSLEWLLSLLSVWGFMIGILSLAVFLVLSFLPYLRQLASG